MEYCQLYTARGDSQAAWHPIEGDPTVITNLVGRRWADIGRIVQEYHVSYQNTVEIDE